MEINLKDTLKSLRQQKNVTQGGCHGDTEIFSKNDIEEGEKTCPTQ